MRPLWPDDTDFRRLVLDVEREHCDHCGRVLVRGRVILRVSGQEVLRSEPGS